MAEEREEAEGEQEERSGTRFPFISLEKALERARALYDQARDHEVLVTDAFEVWGYSLKSSGGHQTVAALKMYGLVRDSGARDARQIALTPEALRYFRDEREEELAKLRTQFSLKPKLLQSLWYKWMDGPPADNIARSYLKVDRGLSDQGARSLLGIYKENLEFTGLTAPDKIPEADELAVVDRKKFDQKREPPLPADPAKGRMQLMEGERELTTGLLSRDASFRLIVSGRISAKEIDMLIRKLELDRDILASQGETEEEAASRLLG